MVLALAASASAQTNATDLLARGSALIQTKPGEAVKVLREALRLDPNLPQIRYQLGLAFHAIGDLADSEAELREELTRVPDSAPAHNYLGIVLFELGNARAAVEEFRTAVRLAPNDPNTHFNLGEALAAIGDKTVADELQKASALAPGDALLARVAAAATTIKGTTIKVDVRQVLVPVVVTDRRGHHVTGLTQKDFKILEDGAEQTITNFSVEHSGLPESDISAAADPARAAPAVPLHAAAPAPHAPARRTYVICIDTLHAAFNNFVSARDALTKLFQHEQSEDSQYVVVALGNTAQVVLNTTRDPAAVLAALKSKAFQKAFLDGQQGGLKPDLERYRRDLNQTRQVCELAAKTHDIPPTMQCEAGKRRMPQGAQTIAELDRTLTIGFLRQFRFLVTQLAQARDRRTIVLLSDGFQIAPGREAYDLLNAFFPELQGYSLQYGERMQDEFEPILKLAAASNITIDTIDSRGLYGLASADAANPGAAASVATAVDRADRNLASANGNTLAEIAEATGGTAFHDNNDLLSGLQRAFADGRDYYTIGYVSTNANRDGKFRAIAVQVRGHDVTINAKRGYWSERAAQ
jgi:VWFA-related protein